jgi:hypothetical protein
MNTSQSADNNPTGNAMNAAEHRALRVVVDSCKAAPDPEKLARAIEQLSMAHYFTDEQYLTQALDDYLLFIEQCQKPEDDDARLIAAILYFRRGSQHYRDRQPDLGRTAARQGEKMAQDYLVENLCNGRFTSFDDVERTLQIIGALYSGFTGLVRRSDIEGLQGEYDLAELFADSGVEDGS